MEVDGSYHYIQDLESISILYPGRPVMSESLKLEFPKDVFVQPRSGILQCPDSDNSDNFHSDAAYSYTSGPTVWKKKVIQSFRWYHVSIPVYTFKKWVSRGTLTNSVMAHIPIDWSKWSQQIETLKLLSAEEKMYVEQAEETTERKGYLEGRKGS